MHTSLALVHHANQYLITDGYDNREGLSAVLGKPGCGHDLAHVLDLHSRFQIPLNLHISGTLLEAIAWHQPQFLEQIRDLMAAGLIELIGSCYGQNIMRFFGPDYNRRQLNEELLLYQVHLGADPRDVQTFWPPERVWETPRMAPVLRDARLRNGGYRYVILDDRILLPSQGHATVPRAEYDDRQHWSPELFQMHEIEDGLGLTAFPIATRLRRSIPPQSTDDWAAVQTVLEGLLVHSADADQTNLLAIYADDMEKVAGIGEWGSDGPRRYEAFLEWLSANSWARPVRVTEWARTNEPAGQRPVETGTFAELAREFDAGEGYEKWYLAQDWAPYRGYFEWAESKVRACAAEGADAGLLALAEKQLLVGNWETAWHTPPSGPHGDAEQHGSASPWARALTSHSRHAAVTAEAACWMHHGQPGAHASIEDVDNDGELEVVLRNEALYVVITNRWGARVTSMFSVAGERGAMVVGNPCDDWNWMEELNKHMDVPRNHPGCFADTGFENDGYEVTACSDADGLASVTMVNCSRDSVARGLRKRYTLEPGSGTLLVDYTLPKALRELFVDFGLSPDYLTLLRGGRRAIKSFTTKTGNKRGFVNGCVSTFVRLPGTPGVSWDTPEPGEFGHGRMVRVAASISNFTLGLGVRHNLPDTQDSALEPELAERVR